jgi:hypothetical protein
MSEGHVPREMLLGGVSIHFIPGPTQLESWWPMIYAKGQFARVEFVLKRELNNGPLVH